MVKKRLTKISSTVKRRMTPVQRDELLIENFVGLQKAMTNLSMKFEQLSGNIVKLLQVFELSAKNVAEEGPVDNKELTKKINLLLEQNKTIAQGLVLLESRVGGQPPQQQGFFRPKPLPRI